MNIHIDYIGGYCPVQAEGNVNGVPFYFKSRGEHWSIGIGGDDPICEPGWSHVEKYGTWPDAGYITLEQAQEFINKGAALYLEEKEGKQ